MNMPPRKSDQKTIGMSPPKLAKYSLTATSLVYSGANEFPVLTSRPADMSFRDFFRDNELSIRLLGGCGVCILVINGFSGFLLFSLCFGQLLVLGECARKRSLTGNPAICSERNNKVRDGLGDVDIVGLKIERSCTVS